MVEGAPREIAVANGGKTSRTAPKLDRLLSASAELMATRGFSQTSIRDVAAETGLSLGGMYYYFQNKEDLLFQIQEKTFASLLKLQEKTITEGGSASERLERLVKNHLSYFISHFNELKVCTFELGSLKDERYDAIAHLRRRYFLCMAEVVGEMLGVPENEIEEHVKTRQRTLFIFGMLNWVFMWYVPEKGDSADALGSEMVDMVLNGFNGGKK
ncbi:MAG: TetR/AcrR family transcriptional regulator [bacterium]|nr:TetR/AcrR family transcriptional regulator [bacterium]